MRPDLHIDRESDKPHYVQLADGIRRLIARGGYSPGQALPPLREIAKAAETNHNTVAVAYRMLQAEGLVEIADRARAIVAQAPARPPPGEDEMRDRLESLFAGWLANGVATSAVRAAVSKALATFRSARRGEQGAKNAT